MPWSLDEASTAAFKGDLKAIKNTPTANINDLHPSRGTTLLYTASRFGHKSIVEWLLANGADVNKANDENGAGSCPLHGAAFGGHPDVLELLIEAGATMADNAYGDSPLADAENPADGVSAAKKKKCIQVLKAMKTKKVKPKADLPSLKRENSDDQDAAVKETAELPHMGMTLKQLQTKASDMGLLTTGTKAVLIKRINDAIKTANGGGKTSPPPAKKAKKAASPVKDEDEKEEKEAPPAKKAKKETKATKEAQEGGDDPTEYDFMQDVEDLKKATFTLQRIDRDTQEFWDLEEKFSACLQGRNEDYVGGRLEAGEKPLTFILKGAERVVNKTLEARFERFKKMLAAKYPDDKTMVRERISFHGTNPKNLASILKTSLLRFKHPLNPCKTQVDDGYFGTNRKGVYVSRYADYTLKYCNDQTPLEAGETCKTIMFRTLPGKTKRIEKMNTGMDPTKGYNSHSSPSYLEWYLFNEAQLCPEYVLEVLAKEDTRTSADDM